MAAELESQVVRRRFWSLRSLTIPLILAADARSVLHGALVRRLQDVAQVYGDRYTLTPDNAPDAQAL